MDLSSLLRNLRAVDVSKVTMYVKESESLLHCKIVMVLWLQLVNVMLHVI